MNIFHRVKGYLLVFCLVAVTILPSQSARGQAQFGIVGGANFAALSDIQANNQAISFDNATAFHAGLFVDLKLGPINLRPAAYYLNAGALFEGSTVFQNDTFDLAYVTIPVDLIVNFGLGPIQPYLFVGPEFRIFTPSGIPAEVEAGLQDFVFNGTAGLGVKFQAPGLGVTLYPHLRYSFGISSYTNDSYQFEGVSVEANDANVRMWLLSLGIGF